MAQALDLLSAYVTTVLKRDGSLFELMTNSYTSSIEIDALHINCWRAATVKFPFGDSGSLGGVCVVVTVRGISIRAGLVPRPGLLDERQRPVVE